MVLLERVELKVEKGLFAISSYTIASCTKRAIASCTKQAVMYKPFLLSITKQRKRRIIHMFVYNLE